jgi:fructose-1-phosphate kinase PfkB-like protein
MLTKELEELEELALVIVSGSIPRGCIENNYW